MCHVSSTLISACTCYLVSFLSATYSICMELMPKKNCRSCLFGVCFYVQKTRDSYTCMVAFILIFSFCLKIIIFYHFTCRKLVIHTCMYALIFFVFVVCLFCFVFCLCFIYGHKAWGSYTCTCALTFFFLLFCVQKTKGTYLSLSKADTSCHCVSSAADMFAHKEERG